MRPTHVAISNFFLILNSSNSEHYLAIYKGGGGAPSLTEQRGDRAPRRPPPRAPFTALHISFKIFGFVGLYMFICTNFFNCTNLQKKTFIVRLNKSIVGNVHNCTIV